MCASSEWNPSKKSKALRKSTQPLTIEFMTAKWTASPSKTSIRSSMLTILPTTRDALFPYRMWSKSGRAIRSNPAFISWTASAFKKISFDKSLCKEPTQAHENRISVLLVEPNRYPRMIEIDDTLEAMQAVVGGDIEEYMPFEDEVAIVCHEEGKLIGLPPNRAIYAEPETVELTYSELADRFRNAESEGKKHLTGYIIFSQESFNKPYDEKSRTYAVSSDNKAFKAGLGGYSIYGSCLDGSDPCVRLDGYMRGENAWKIEKCYLKEASREMLDIICGKFFICHAPYEAERFQSLPPDLAEKYREKFQYPERFARINDKIVAVPFKPAKADRER